MHGLGLVPGTRPGDQPSRHAVCSDLSALAEVADRTVPRNLYGGAIPCPQIVRLMLDRHAPIVRRHIPP